MQDNSPPPHCGGGRTCVGDFSCLAALSWASLALRSFSFREKIATDLALFMRLCLTLVFLAASSSAALAAAAASSSWLDTVWLLSLSSDPFGSEAELDEACVELEDACAELVDWCVELAE